MSPITSLIILIALLIISWAVWFVIELIRYITSGEYEMDKRLKDICK